MRYRMLFFTVPGLAVIVSLAGCGSEQAKGAPDKPPAGTVATPAKPAPVTQLTINVKASPESAAKTWTLTCDPAGGSHPEAAKACAALAKAKAPFTPVAKDQQCTMIYGGPEEATVTGTWKDQKVDAKFSRKNGCELSRWTALNPVLGELPPVR
jgi:hypothetical protein